MPGLIEAEILPVNSFSSPIVVDILTEWGFPVWEEETPKRKRLKVVYDFREEKSLKKALFRLSEATGLKLKLLPRRQIEESFYLEQWSKYLKPFLTGKKLRIVPLTTDNLRFEREKNKRVPIYIKPGLAFGTGSHPTTFLALELLEEYLEEGARVLDVGTGSGILIIAARKLGAGKSVAIDCDRQAIENAVFNSKLNQTEDIVFYQLPLSLWKDFSFDLILANLTARDIIENYPIWQKFFSALFIFSGILRTERKKVESLFNWLKFTKLEEKREENWIAQVYRSSR